MPAKESIRLGQYRETMAANPLLRKAELGKPMQRGFVLPPEDFIYGRPNHCIDGGAQEAMQYAVLAYKRSQKADQENTSNLKKDFIRINKACIQKGLVTAQEQARASKCFQNIYVKPTAKTTSSENAVSPSLRLPPDTTFGIMTRPSTPVFELLEHRYQTKWLQNQQKKQNQSDECAKRAANGKLYKTQTKVQQLLRELQHDRKTKNEQMRTSKLWQMPKWGKTGPHLKTFRSETVRERSFAEHEATRNTKQGFLGQGIAIEYGS